MEKLISRKQHGFADYTYIPLMAAAPEVFGFEDEDTATLLCRIQGGTVLLTTLLTRAEWGVFKVIPFKTHLLLDLSLGAFSIAAPWVFGFSKNKKARNAFLLMGATSIAASLLTEPKEMPATES
ncbi:SPW repeat protein [uncultured Mucilaginibacter sp.]|uniref:SPW repeat domain-containing protein n=1 Tax=uncultured Mucilaginibacter sp. TaxID=797541 RepID=UPI0026268D9B|nr:SPW repeat protein [uncultured Mucilaginibacter sp.]